MFGSINFYFWRKRCNEKRISKIIVQRQIEIAILFSTLLLWKRTVKQYKVKELGVGDIKSINLISFNHMSFSKIK